MKTFSQFINEAFTNAVGNEGKALETKEKYASQVWDLLQKSYKGIGGIKGNGFNSKEDMIEKIPMWKMIVDGGVVKAAVLYKDKGGRKSVAMGSDGSDFARKHVASAFAEDFKRAYGEKSKGALGLLLKTVPWSVLEAFIKTPDEANKILGRKAGELVAVNKMAFKDLPEDAQTTLTKNPELKNYGYVRTISGSRIFKVMVGTVGKSIE